MESVKDKIFSIIQRKGRGTVFCAQDFLPKFKRWEIDRSLTDLEKEKKIQRIIAGLYTFPLYSKLLKKYVSPSYETIAYAIARKNNWTIFPEGNTALNYLGLSTQLPAKYIYLSSGRCRKYSINGICFEFREVNSKTMITNDKNANLVVQAIIASGKTYAQEIPFIEKLSKCFPYAEWVRIEKKAKRVSTWILNIISKAKDTSNARNC